MKQITKRHKSFLSENESYEFYFGGTHNDAESVRAELERDYDLKGTLAFDSTYGWIVRVRKEAQL